MLVFPQLSTGAAALYPLRRRRSRRAVVNELRDGNSLVYADPDWAVKEWDLACEGLNESERDAIEALFAAVQGRRGTFTLLEPAGNLLSQSEAFESAEWDLGPLVSVTAGIDDPFGGTEARRVTNSGPGAGDVAQVLEAPGDFRYAVSVWARANSASSVALFAETAGGSVEQAFTLTGSWRRIVLPVAMELATEVVTLGARLTGGAAVDLFGMQVDAQVGPGEYQKTGARGGVHSHARFAMDALTVRARGTDVFDAEIRIVSKGS